MKFVATSDWHLDQSTAGVDRIHDLCTAIDISVEAAIEMQADAYLMCGDLCDPHTVRSHRSVRKAVEVQTRLWDAGVVPIFVAGNHDIIEDGSGVTTMSALRYTGDRGHVFETPSYIGLKNRSGEHLCNLIALPFTATSHAYDPEEFVRGIAQDMDDPILVVGHLNLHGITPGSEATEMPRGRDVFWPTDAIRERFPNSAMVGGHIHTPQQYDGVHIIGSLARLRFPECDNETGYMVMEV